MSNALFIKPSTLTSTVVGPSVLLEVSGSFITNLKHWQVARYYFRIKNVQVEAESITILESSLTLKIVFYREH